MRAAAESSHCTGVLLCHCQKNMPSNGSKFSFRPGRKQVLRAVASFEFLKGSFVLAMGICALMLVHKDVWLMAESLLALLHINSDRHSAQVFLDIADNITDARLWAAAQIAFAYAALRFAEAYGLWNQKSWAEWIAFVSGALLLPLEVRELFRGITLLRSTLFVGNLSIVLYMYYVLRSGAASRRAAGTAAQGS